MEQEDKRVGDRFFRSQAQRLSDSDGGACDACQKLKTAAEERRGEERVLC